MVAWKKKAHVRAEAIEAVCTRTENLVTSLPMLAMPELETLPAVSWTGDLDPAAGELDEGRAQRKRQQITSAAMHALTLAAHGAHVVEFGAGQGHLGLLMAYLRPDVSVTLVEVKAYSCNAARERVRALSLGNVQVFEGTVEAFGLSGTAFDVVVGLHLCGLLTDATLELAAARGAAACIIPCCYAQLFGAVDHNRGGSATPRNAPFSTAFRTALGEDLLPQFAEVTRGAERVAIGSGGAFDIHSPSFVTAQRCMRIIDTDRLLWLLERFGGTKPGGNRPSDGAHASKDGSTCEDADENEISRLSFGVALRSLAPLSCSPKNSVILVQPKKNE